MGGSTVVPANVGDILREHRSRIKILEANPSSASGIRFDTYPQAGHWLYVEMDGPGGGPNGWAFESRDPSGNGQVLNGVPVLLGNVDEDNNGALFTLNGNGFRFDLTPAQELAVSASYNGYKILKIKHGSGAVGDTLDITASDEWSVAIDGNNFMQMLDPTIGLPFFILCERGTFIECDTSNIFALEVQGDNVGFLTSSDSFSATETGNGSLAAWALAVADTHDKAVAVRAEAERNGTAIAAAGGVWTPAIGVMSTAKVPDKAATGGKFIAVGNGATIPSPPDVTDNINAVVGLAKSGSSATVDAYGGAFQATSAGAGNAFGLQSLADSNSGTATGLKIVMSGAGTLIPIRVFINATEIFKLTSDGNIHLPAGKGIVNDL